MQYKLILRILISFTARVGCMLILSVSLATPGSRIAALRLTVLATLSGATVEGCNNVRAYPVPTPIEHCKWARFSAVSPHLTLAVGVTTAAR